LASIAGLSMASALTFSADEAKNRPVTKVINLLKDMQKQLEAEGEQDQEIYDKMACWCKTNDAEKSKAIADAEQRIAMLTDSIEEGTAKSAQLTAEIENLEKEVAANQQALGKATALRQKELAEFNAAEKDMLQAISSLKAAITVLKKHNSMIQTGTMENIHAVVNHLFKKYGDSVLSGVVGPSEKKTVTAFLQQGEGENPYANQSGEIFGILGNMLDTFQSDLASSQKEENAKQAAYEELKAAKEEEIAAGQAQVDKKTDELAATDEKLANDKQDQKDTRNSLAADEEFLANLKEKCSQTDQEFEQRQKTRAEEVAAVGKALEFLSSDEAHDLFTKTFNFVQVSKTKSRRNQAAKILEKAAQKANSPMLSAIAASVKLDAFTKVKKAIDDMVTALLKEKEDEIKHRDFCVDAFHKNESETTKTTRDRDDLLAKIDELAALIKSLEAAIDDLNNQVAEAKKQLKRAGEDREKENLEFQKTVAEQRATIKLLTGAMGALQGFYAKETKGVALVQQPAGPPPPAGFKSYENNAGGNGVISMITQIINDSKAMEAEAIHDEEDAQKAYESFVQETNKTIDQKNKEIINKTEQKATAEGDKVEAETQAEAANIQLEQLANEVADLHKGCDFTMKNFDIRQEARDQEVEALRQAKSILSGSDLGSK
jgi:chromosome segregation ATPase